MPNNKKTNQKLHKLDVSDIPFAKKSIKKKEHPVKKRYFAILDKFQQELDILKKKISHEEEKCQIEIVEYDKFLNFLLQNSVHLLKDSKKVKLEFNINSSKHDLEFTPEDKKLDVLKKHLNTGKSCALEEFLDSLYKKNYEYIISFESNKVCACEPVCSCLYYNYCVLQVSLE